MIGEKIKNKMVLYTELWRSTCSHFEQGSMYILESLFFCTQKVAANLILGRFIFLIHERNLINKPDQVQKEMFVNELCDENKAILTVVGVKTMIEIFLSLTSTD